MCNYAYNELYLLNCLDPVYCVSMELLHLQHYDNPRLNAWLSFPAKHLDTAFDTTETCKPGTTFVSLFPVPNQFSAVITVPKNCEGRAHPKAKPIVFGSG